MAVLTTDIPVSPKHLFSRALSAIGGVFASISAATRMSAEAQELYSLTDRELAARGLGRDTLDRHLLKRFRDTCLN